MIKEDINLYDLLLKKYPDSEKLSEKKEKVMNTIKNKNHEHFKN